MQLTSRNPRIRDDDGVTLIELLVAIVILGIIMVSLGGAMYTYFRTTNATTNRVSESHDAQVATTYWAQDVAGLGVRDWTDQSEGFPFVQSIFTPTTPTRATKCLGPRRSTLVVQLTWGNPSTESPSAVIRVSYVIERVDGDEQLHRIECDDDTSSDVIVVHNLQSATASCGQLTASGDPSDPTCTAEPAPDTVNLALVIRVAGSAGADYDITLTGRRRQT